VFAIWQSVDGRSGLQERRQVIRHVCAVHELVIPVAAGAAELKGGQDAHLLSGLETCNNDNCYYCEWVIPVATASVDCLMTCYLAHLRVLGLHCTMYIYVSMLEDFQNSLHTLYSLPAVFQTSDGMLSASNTTPEV
jgi:hypothetical protein